MNGFALFRWHLFTLTRHNDGYQLLCIKQREVDNVATHAYVSFRVSRFNRAARLGFGFTAICNLWPNRINAGRNRVARLRMIINENGVKKPQMTKMSGPSLR
jgi:hypothetical protein